MRWGVARGSLGMFTGVFLGFEGGVDGDAGVDLEAAVRGDVDAEL